MAMSQPAVADAIPASAAPGYAPQQYSAMSGMAMGMGMGQFGGGGMYRPSFASGFGASSYMNQQPVYEGKGKQKAEEGRFVELADDKAWDAAFEKIAAPPQVSLPDAVEEPDVDSDPMAAQLDAEWRRMQSDLNSYSAMDKEMAEWEAQYGSQFANPDGDFSFSNRDAFDYDELLRNPPVFEFQQEENAFLDSADPFEEGKRLLAAGAPFIEVEAAFEAACQKDQGRCDAWTALGETLAADEKELLAIKALERAISLPSATGGESAWLVRFAWRYLHIAQLEHSRWPSRTSTKGSTARRSEFWKSG
jgi:peroxin-5